MGTLWFFGRGGYSDTAAARHKARQLVDYDVTVQRCFGAIYAGCIRCLTLRECTVPAVLCETLQPTTKHRTSRLYSGQ